MRWLKSNKKGSSIVLLAMVFMALVMCITMAIGISRMLVVKSEVEVFGYDWTKAILSEYDIHLLEDYGIMAYFGNEDEVKKKIDMYLSYSAKNKLDANIGNTDSDLSGYEMGNAGNFRKALKLAYTSSEIDSLINNFNRERRSDSNTEENYTGRTIKNEVVLDTLPSAGLHSTFNINSIAKWLSEQDSFAGLREKIANAGVEYAFIEKNLGNNVTKGSSKDGYFKNEWEYIINGKPDDEANLNACKDRIGLLRNALNLAYLNKDPEKKAVILAVSECINPAGGILTQAIVTEAWALLETEEDMKALMRNERIPFMKDAMSWKTDISSVFSSEKFINSISEEEMSELEKGKEELMQLSGGRGCESAITQGQCYDDYLLAMISMMDEELRTLRIMDVVQINMKYRYYEDFNMDEYYIGTRFSIKANGKEYEFEECYK